VVSIRRLSGFVLGILVLLPTVSAAQATIAGTVRDTSGAVLPGVTVEASSPALIEKVRTTVTDSNGQYQVVALRPGTYAVTFTLTGFKTVKREGFELTAATAATVNADLQVGGIAETITVSGEAPVVDVQNTSRNETLSSSVLASVPATRGYNALVFLVPSITGGSNQVDLTPLMRIFYSHGGRANEGRVLVDGLSVGAALNGGGVSLYVPDTTNAQEMSLNISGGLGEAETGGAVANVIPKTGGNTFAGTGFLSTAGKWSQGSNLDDRLRGFGLQDQNGIVNIWDTSASVGGPIRRDRLWFYGVLRSFGQQDTVAGMYANKNAGDPAKWNYDPDLSVQAREATKRTITAIRLTAQLTPRNKLGLYFDHQQWCDGSSMLQTGPGCRLRGPDWVANGQPTIAPEAASGSNGTLSAAGYHDKSTSLGQVTWSSPFSNRLLLEAGLSSFSNIWGTLEPPGAIRNLVPVQEQASINGMPAGLLYRGLGQTQEDLQNPNVWRASASYVTGSNAAKIGYQGAYHVSNLSFQGDQQELLYRFNNGVPNQLTMNIRNWNTSDKTRYDAVYAQDQWTRSRLTLQGAVRYDHAYSWAPSDGNGSNAPDVFLPNLVQFNRTDGVTGFNDITLRGGAAWDIAGNGKTSLKVNLGKYLQSANNQDRYTIANPAQTTLFPRATNRSWNDANHDYVPNCDLMNPLANGECGAWQTPNFGSSVGATINPAILHGWGIRPSDWQFGASVQREIFRRTSLEVSYNRRWFQNFLVTDNLALGPNDVDAFTVVAPQNPGLPGGGGYTATYLDPRTLAVNNYTTFASDYGNWTQYWHGLDVNVNARLRGLVLQGGTSTGRGVQNWCDVAAKLPELFLGTRTQTSSCSVTEPWQTQFRGLASFVVPKVDVQVSAALQLKPGTIGIAGNTLGTNGGSINANYAAPNVQIMQSLGRLPTGGLINGNTIVNLVTPGQVYGDRVNQFDLRLAKLLHFGRTRTQLGVDLYNLFNANPGLTFNDTFSGTGTTWLRPTSLLLPRFARFNVTFDF
jgi:hypothetical protein